MKYATKQQIKHPIRDQASRDVFIYGPTCRCDPGCFCAVMHRNHKTAHSRIKL